MKNKQKRDIYVLYGMGILLNDLHINFPSSDQYFWWQFFSENSVTTRAQMALLAINKLNHKLLLLSIFFCCCSRVLQVVLSRILLANLKPILIDCFKFNLEFFRTGAEPGGPE